MSSNEYTFIWFLPWLIIGENLVAEVHSKLQNTAMYSSFTKDKTFCCILAPLAPFLWWRASHYTLCQFSFEIVVVFIKYHVTNKYPKEVHKEDIFVMSCCMNRARALQHGNLVSRYYMQKS